MNDRLQRTEPFRIGAWLVEPSLSRVSCDDTTTRLEHKMMEVLVCLAENAGELVNREQIIERVWATEYISDNALTHAIAEIRAALGDDARHPSYIETIHRRGYRMIATVVDLEVTRPRPRTQSARYKLVSGRAEFLLSEGENLIGRDPEAAVCIDSVRVSWRHGRIVVDEAGATLEDLGSKNGTYLNGRRLEQPTALADGDEIRIGRHLARLRFSVLTAATLTELSGSIGTDMN